MSSDTLLSTSMVDNHRSMGAKMVDFAGWDMPVQYSGVREEHLCVRENCGLFDLSHMGELEFRGPAAGDFIQSLVTNDVSKIEPFQAQYTCMTNEQGAILDDMLVYRFDNRWWLVVNASNKDKIWNWVEPRIPDGVEGRDISGRTALIAVQGPKSEEVLQPLVQADLGQLGYYRLVETQVAGHPAVVSRTGYTGEDGFEIYLEWELGPEVWERLASNQTVKPIGLGARDTLRLEAGYSLYGHELTEEVTPYQVGLGWVVKLATDFIGKGALEREKSAGLKTTVIGFEMVGRQIPRQGYPIFAGDREIGRVTSGTFSPSLGKGVGLALVEREFRSPGTDIEIEIRGKRHEAKTARPPLVSGSVKRN